METISIKAEKPLLAEAIKTLKEPTNKNGFKVCFHGTLMLSNSASVWKRQNGPSQYQPDNSEFSLNYRDFFKIIGATKVQSLQIFNEHGDHDDENAQILYRILNRNDMIT